MYISTVFAIFICDALIITTKEVHVVLVYNRRVICNCSWDLIGASCGLYKPPFVSAHKLGFLFIHKFVKAWQVQFIERIQWTFTNVKASINVKFPVKYEGTVITTSLWLLIFEPHFVPILQLFGIVPARGTHSLVLLKLLWLVSFRCSKIALCFFYHLI